MGEEVGVSEGRRKSEGMTSSSKFCCCKHFLGLFWKIFHCPSRKLSCCSVGEFHPSYFGILEFGGFVGSTSGLSPGADTGPESAKSCYLELHLSLNRPSLHSQKSQDLYLI